MRTLFAAIFSLCAVTSAQASVEVRFYEGAPKDRFTIMNTGECMLTDFELVINLDGSAGGLLFDTTENGAGVEVYQPFEVSEGVMELQSGKVFDGDRSLSLRILELPVAGQASFTIDVDDTLKNSDLGQIRVSGAEINGGGVQLIVSGDKVINGTFTEEANVRLANVPCVSS